ncbi:MAG: anaerobic glycerol-3-phosphate dehydrogenase subunit C, partial [Candidatus Rokuibacteriota bacterium]
MTLDIRSEAFWAPGNVEQELRRVYDVCNGCRRCITLCPSFKDLFRSLDTEEVDGESEKLAPGALKRVVDLCYQCKLCYNHCPYTPPHRWQVDFPRLMLRARAAEAKKRGVTLQDRLLGNTDLVGRLGSLTAPLANWAGTLAPHRAFLQAVAGIHKRRNLPRFSRQRFSAWFSRRRRSSFVPQAKVALFATCVVEYNDPTVGKAAVAVLERNRVDVTLPPQRCCGMPYLDGGAVAEAQALIRQNVKALAAAVREGREIVVPGPTCSYMLKQEYPWLDGSEDARLVANSTRDLFEYLMRLHAEGRLDTNFSGRPGKVAYHLPCHLKAQNLGTKSADLLRLIPGALVEVIERCSGVDGTWGFKREYYELSLKVAEPLFKGIEDARPDWIASDCPLAALQIAQGTGATPRHPIQIVADAYGLTPE